MHEISILARKVGRLNAIALAASVTIVHPLAAVAAEDCVECHRQQSAALVMEWERSLHAAEGVSCIDCHGAAAGENDAWRHEGEWVSTLVTPKDCGVCHQDQVEQFSVSHHARGGEILASLDNILAERVAGMPGNNADAVNGCWQCHGSIVDFARDADGNVLRVDGAPDGKPILDAATWPNSGIGRLNPDGSKGSCHACHSRHAFDAKLARGPENCGKCHLGPDHPQLEVYNESKHGIAFHANRDLMALDKDGDWVLGHDYSVAPTCATCHTGSYVLPDGGMVGNSHDVGERISWTLRPVISTKINSVQFTDGHREDYPDTRPLPKVGDTVATTEKYAENGTLKSRVVERQVDRIVTWQERREKMKGACLTCHGQTYVDNFYIQFDDLVTLYNEKFARPASALMDELAADGVLNPDAPFEHDVQWIFWELWHHEGRRARHGAAMMGPDYTHWHGMYEVSKHFYMKFLPAVIEVAEGASAELGEKYRRKVDAMMAEEEHVWKHGLDAKEAEELRRSYEERYGE
jgi:predicted CxxxxCH...CXXCH cytochrome family protein